MENNNERLVEEYARLSTQTSEALNGLKGAIKEMNDTNVLHTQKLGENTTAINNIEKFWGKIVFILTIAIAVLAGVEKLGKLLGL